MVRARSWWCQGYIVIISLLVLLIYSVSRDQALRLLLKWLQFTRCTATPGAELVCPTGH